MDIAFCPDIGKKVSAEKVYSGAVSRYNYFECPICSETVVFRNQINARPYFAHKRYNKSCPLSVKGDGGLFAIRSEFISSDFHKSLKSAKYTAEELKSMGYTAEKLRSAGYNVKALMD